jgi:hypothetical protein
MIGTTGTSFPAVEARHDVPGVALDDRQQLPAVDHRQQDRGRCHPWPWMIGTTFPPSIGTGTTGTSFPAIEARHHLPGVDHRQQDRGRCHPWPWMIGNSFPASIGTAGTTRHHRGRCEPWPWMIGTTFPAVDRHGRHDGHQLPAVNHRQQGRTAQLGR